MSDKLKIGILHQGTEASYFQAQIINFLCNSDRFEVYWVKLQTQETLAKKLKRKLDDRGLVSVVSDVFFKLFEQLEKSIFSVLKVSDNETTKMDAFYFYDTIEIGYTTRKFNSCYINGEGLKKLNSLKFDFLYRSSGGGIFKGDILGIPKHGIISLHHGDNNWNRGGPPGFWEVYRGLPTTGFIIQILNSNLDGGSVIERGWCRTARYYTLNRRAISIAANGCLIDFFERISKEFPGVNLTSCPSNIFDGNILRNPTFTQLIFYIGKVASRDAIKAAERYIFRRRHNWRIGYQFRSWQGASLGRSKTLIPPRGRFYADPFIFKRDEKVCIFYEDYSYSEQKGVISCSEVTTKGEFNKYEDLLNLDVHQSFPYLFECEGALYMVPETRGSRNIQLFRCDKFPDRWVKVKDLINSINAVDSVIFYLDDVWWMLTTTAVDDFSKADSILRCFKAKHPVLSEWKECSASPLFRDPLVGRNGGILLLNDRIYRVSQTPGFQHYGKSCCIWEVSASNKELYFSERQQISADFSRKVKSIHHFHGGDQFFAFDFEVH